MTVQDEQIISGAADVQPLPDILPAFERARRARRTAELFAGLDGASVVERREIRDEVLALHLTLATAAARRYGFHREPDDAVQVARLGLVEAFDRFDPSRQTGFSQFAWVTMHGLLLRHLRDHGWAVRPPRALQESANTLRRATPVLAQRLGRRPAPAELAEELGWTVATVRTAQVAEQGLTATSLDALAGESASVVEHVDWDLITDRVCLREMVAALSEEERELLRLRYVEELTQAQIGRRCGRSQMQVSRILARLTAKLRTSLDGAAHDAATDHPTATAPAATAPPGLRPRARHDLSC